MRAISIAIILIMLISPVGAMIVNEPSFRLKLEPWLKGLKISENGTFAVCCNGKELVAFNYEKVTWRKKMHAVCLDVSGNYIAVGAGKTVYLMNERGKVLWKMNLKCTVTSVAVSKNGTVAVGCIGKIYILKDKKVLACFNAENDIGSISISKCGGLVAGEDLLGNLYILLKCSKDVCGSKFCTDGWSWTYENGWYMGRKSLGIPYPCVVKVYGDRVAVDNGDMNEVLVFNKFGYLVEDVRVEGYPISVAISKDMLAVGCRDGKLYVFDNFGNVLWKLDMLFGPVHVAISENGKFVVASSGKRVVMFDKNGKIIWVYDNFDDEIDFVSVSNDGRSVAGSLSGFVYFLRSKVKPDADFEFSPKNPKMGEKVRFLAKSIADEYVWNFGDGKSITTNEPEVTHAYSKPGKYVVRLTVERDGMVNSTSKIVTVEAVNEPKENKQTKPTPKPKPTPTPTPKKSFPISLPKIPGFEAFLGLIAIAIALRKR